MIPNSKLSNLETQNLRISKKMKTLQFLLLGKNEAILAILLRLVNADENWNGVAFNNEKDAQE